MKQNNLIDTAVMYEKLGLSVIATDVLKKSVVSWREFQTRRADIAELMRMFSHTAAFGLAVVTGKASGNLEVIDIDSKYDLEGGIMKSLCDAIKTANAALLDKLVKVRSKSGGYHFYYRCSEIEPNQALARRETTKDERTMYPKQTVKVLIETRGEGGYIIVPPTPGYLLLHHNFTKIPDISPAERNIILTSARSFNLYEERQVERRMPKSRPSGELSPLDDYNLRGDVIGLLQKHGWTVVGHTTKRTYLRRPGDTDKRTSGSFNHELNYFSVFSTSTDFTPKVGYLPYAVYALLECRGDYKEAARKLSREGYGQSIVPGVNTNKCLVGRR